MLVFTLVTLVCTSIVPLTKLLTKTTTTVQELVASFTLPDAEMLKFMVVSIGLIEPVRLLEAIFNKTK